MTRPAYLGRCLFAALTVWLAAFAASWPSSHALLPWMPFALATLMAVLTAPIAVGRYGGAAGIAARSLLRWQAAGLALSLFIPASVAFGVANLLGLPWSLLRAHPSDSPSGLQLVLRLGYGFGADATVLFALLSLFIGSKWEDCAANGLAWGLLVLGLTILFTGGCSGCVVVAVVWLATMVGGASFGVDGGHEALLGLLGLHLGVCLAGYRAGIKQAQSELPDNVE